MICVVRYIYPRSLSYRRGGGDCVTNLPGDTINTTSPNPNPKLSATIDLPGEAISATSSPILNPNPNLSATIDLPGEAISADSSPTLTSNRSLDGAGIPYPSRGISQLYSTSVPTPIKMHDIQALAFTVTVAARVPTLNPTLTPTFALQFTYPLI